MVRGSRKNLHGGQVITPESVIDDHASRIVRGDVGSRQFRSSVGSAVADLSLDRRRRLAYLHRKVQRQSRLHGLWFEQLAGTVRQSMPPDQLEDLHDQGLAALAKENEDEACIGVAVESPNQKGEQ